MSRKSRFSFEVKLKAVKQYLNGERNYPSIANALDVAPYQLLKFD